VTHRQRKLSFGTAAVVLLGITVVLALREPGSGSRSNARSERPVATTVIRTGTPPAQDPTETGGSRRASPTPSPRPSISTAPATATQGERESENAPAVAPPAAHAATAAARAFLDGYLPYSYGRAQAQRIRAAATSLLRELNASPPRVPAGVAQARPRLVSVHAVAATGGSDIDVVALVEDGQRRYRIPLAVRSTGRGWIVTAVSG
jgi:hypothetical protein